MPPNRIEQIGQGVQQRLASDFKPDQASGGFNMQLSAQTNFQPKTQPKESFFSAVAGSVGSAVKALPSIVGKVAETVYGSIERVGTKAGRLLAHDSYAQSYEQALDSNFQIAENWTRHYRAGNMTKDELASRLQEVMDDNKAIQQEYKDLYGFVSAPDADKQMWIDLASIGGLIISGGTLTTGAAVTAEAAPLVTSLAAVGKVEDAVQLSSAILKANNIGRATLTAEAVLSKVPSLGKLIQATPEAASLMKQAFNMVIKNPIKYNLLVRDPINAYYAAVDGQYGKAAVGAALIGLAAFEGGPVGVLSDLLKRGKGKLGEVTFGKAGFIDEMSKIIDDDLVKHVQGLQKTNPAKYTEALRALKLFEGTNVAHFDGDVKSAVEWVAEWHAKHGNPLANYNAEQLTDYWIDFQHSLTAVKKLAKDGLLEIDGTRLSAADAARVGIGKFGTEEKYALINMLKQMPDNQTRIHAVEQMVSDGYGWAQNPNMRTAIQAAVETGDDFAKNIMKVSTGRTIKVAGGQAFPRNYFPIYLSKKAKGYDSQLLQNLDKITSNTEVADVIERSVAPKGIASAIGGFFEGLGLSPRDRNATAYLNLRRNISQNLLDTGVKFETSIKGAATDVDHVLDKLGEVASTKREIFDLRQLKISEIQDALKVGAQEARQIRGAIVDAYVQIPLQIRGLGNKIMDINSKYNPLALKYSRVQSSLRYAYNPFFAAQERIETETFAQALSGGKKLQFPGINEVRAVFNRNSEKYYDDVVKKLETRGVFAGSGRGEFADGGIIGISAHLRPSQKVSIAGFVDSLATKSGMSVDDYLANNGQQVTDMAREIVQYGRKGALNSPFFTTLNLAIFPARYNIKVVKLAGQVLAKQSPMDQVILINSLMGAGDWLNSQEGQRWQAQNAEAIGVLKYFTPINSLGQISKILTGNAESVSDYGQLGGLPFGVISQILTHQGIIQTNTPYIDPRNGEVLPDYIPKTTKARAKSALDDLISSVFSYPGAVIGLKSKTSMVRDFSGKIIPVSQYDKNEFDKVDRSNQLSDNAKARQNVIRNYVSGGGIKPPSAVDPSNPFGSYKIPPPEKLKPLVPRSEQITRYNNKSFPGVKPRSASTSKEKIVARPMN